MNILVTGGPVFAHIDAVKIVTNRFKGGLMAELASWLSAFANVTYLTTKDAKHPPSNPQLKTIHQNGFDDYQRQVLDTAHNYDAVVLGAAVANLIPLNPLKGKFPSHNYKVGDVIPIDFTIAPRIIDEVKKVAPKTHLFGFKLLSNVEHDELVRAAYGVLLESKATAVFANDTKDLLTKYAVTKERGVHKLTMEEMGEFILKTTKDEYYRTVQSEGTLQLAQSFDMASTFNTLKKQFGPCFKPVPEGYVFGTIAVRHPNGGFLTTGRGKTELDDQVFVREVIHKERMVITLGEKKASLNAPLLDWIFRTNPNVNAIVHTHMLDLWHPQLDYAPPGTVRDSQRNVTKTFSIRNHGAFYLMDKDGKTIV
jgi:hypothetical protein